METNFDILDTMYELFEHPDTRVRLYIIDEIIKGEFSHSEKEEFVEKALKSKNTRIAEKTVEAIFKNFDDISDSLIRSLLSLLCVTHNIKIVDTIIDNLAEYPVDRIVKVISEVLENYVPELHRNIFFLLIKLDTGKSFEIILSKLLIEEKSRDGNIKFFREILEKKVRHIRENDSEPGPYIERIYDIIQHISSESLRNYMLKISLMISEEAVDHFCDYYENSAYRSEITEYLEKVNSQWLFSTFQNRLKTCGDKNTHNILKVAVKIFSHIHPEKVYDLITSYHSCLNDFEEIADILVESNNINLISKMLDNTNPRILSLGLELAVHFQNPRLSEQTVRLTKNPDPGVRMKALEVLSNYSVYEMLPIYREMLSDPDDQVQNKVLTILSRYDDEKINNLLVQELNNERLRNKIIAILGKRNLNYFFDNFEKLNDNTRQKMATALIKTTDEILDKAVMLCQSPDVEKRYMGVKTLAYILPDRQKDILPQFRKMTDDPDSYIRSTISISLKNIDSPMATIILLNLLKDPNKRVRANCIESFMQTKNRPGVVSALSKFLEDSNNRIKGNAIIVLYKLGREDVVEQIEDMLDSNDKWMKVTALYVLGELALSEYGMELVPMLASNDKDIRKNALISLIKMNDPKFHVYIKRLTNDPDPAIREAAQTYIKNS